MPTHIQGLHHITALASDARRTDQFFVRTLGLRRVKKTVNFDAPEVYHLYYGDATGAPGSVMTYFPFPDLAPGNSGAGVVGVTRFAVPPGSLGAWTARLTEHGVANIASGELFGAGSLGLDGPDGERLMLVEAEDPRVPWIGGDVGQDMAIRGFHSAGLNLDAEGTKAACDILALMGYTISATQGNVRRLTLPDGNGADVVDIETVSADRAREGAGSVHHIAFSVPDRARQADMRNVLAKAGLAVTKAIDRDYFHAIYFRIPGGVLFEIATNEPGFIRDEDEDRLGTELKLPDRHEHLRATLEQRLPPLDAV